MSIFTSTSFCTAMVHPQRCFQKVQGHKEPPKPPTLSHVWVDPLWSSLLLLLLVFRLTSCHIIHHISWQQLQFLRLNLTSVSSAICQKLTQPPATSNHVLDNNIFSHLNNFTPTHYSSSGERFCFLGLCWALERINGPSCRTFHFKFWLHPLRWVSVWAAKGSAWSTALWFSC